MVDPKVIFVIVGLICLTGVIILTFVLTRNKYATAGCPTGKSCRGECPSASSGCPLGQFCTTGVAPIAPCEPGTTCQKPCPPSPAGQVCTSPNRCISQQCWEYGIKPSALNPLAPYCPGLSAPARRAAPQSPIVDVFRPLTGFSS